MISRWTLLLLAFSLVHGTEGGNPPPMLRATLTELAPRPRRAAPEWIEVSLSSRSTAIREGALEFTMNEWGSTIYRYRTHDLVINSGDQRFRFLLPAASSTGANSTRTIALRFIEKGGVAHLGEFPLVTSQRDDQTHVIAVVRQSFRAGANETYPLWQALRLERFAPEQGPKFDTTPIFLDPADVPQDPLGFFPFDLVLIESDAFGKMREKTRTALGQWVNAGGSLCVMADRGLEAEQVEELNRWAAVDPQWKPLMANESGRVAIPGNKAFARVNFGRMAIMAELPPEDVEGASPSWRAASIFLWRVVAHQAKAIEKDGKWRLRGGEGAAADQEAWKRRRRLQQESEWRKFDQPTWEVFPRSVRVVPLWILVTVIGAYLILIGPADWFILGALRRRRLTWLTFPLVAILVTAGTVFLVQRFMGTANRTGSIVISDIGATGRVLRETRIELELPASQELATTPMKHALLSPVNSGSRYARWRSEWMDLTFQGQYPARFDYIRPQRQWSPETVRITTVADNPDTSGINWDAFNIEFLEKYQGVFKRTLTPDRQGYDDARVFDETVERVVGVGNQKNRSFSIFTKWGVRDIRKRPTDVTWRHGITMASRDFSDSLITHVSPNGFSRSDDLRILESKDPARTVVVVAVREGDIIRVWRRLYLH